MTGAETFMERLRGMDVNQLLEVNKMVVNTIRFKQGQQERLAATRFMPGTRAKFHSDKRGRTVTIRIDKINQKTVSGTEVASDGTMTMRTWRVSPSMLTPIA